jgi:hypothetical protein
MFNRHPSKGKHMKTFLAFIGGIHLVLFILGALNIIDYHVCIKDAGKCTAAIRARGRDAA